MEPRIKWLGHASFRIEHGGRTIYIDPWKLRDGPKADLILITHSHFDHYSEDDISKLMKGDTVLIGAHDVNPKAKMTHVRPGEIKDLKWAKIKATRAYNPDKQFHPRSNDWLGFIVEIGGKRIYHCGDTDIIPEMKDLGPIDVALLTIGGTYTMDPSEAAQAAGIIRPGLAIPMHWGDIVGDRSHAERFAELSPVPTELLDPEH